MWQRLTCIHETFLMKEPTFFIKKVISQISILQEMYLSEHLETTENIFLLLLIIVTILKQKGHFMKSRGFCREVHF